MSAGTGFCCRGTGSPFDSLPSWHEVYKYILPKRLPPPPRHTNHKTGRPWPAFGVEVRMLTRSSCLALPRSCLVGTSSSLQISGMAPWHGLPVMWLLKWAVSTWFPFELKQPNNKQGILKRRAQLYGPARRVQSRHRLGWMGENRLAVLSDGCS